jgi:LPXTG-motif cell wall-anchored protein
MLRRILAVAAIVMVAGVGVAQAQTGGSLLPVAGVSAIPASGAPGSPAVCESRGHASGSDVFCEMLSDPVFLGSAKADANGIARVSFKVPNLPPGNHTLRSTGIGPDGKVLVQSTAFFIPGASGNNLPKTGDDSSLPMAQIGAGAVAVGGLFVLAAKRRKVKATA